MTDTSFDIAHGAQADTSPDTTAAEGANLDCSYTPPVGGFPEANPKGTRVPVHSRAQCVPSADAAREMSAYSETDYDESVVQAKRGRRTPERSKRGKAQPVGGSYGNSRDPQPSDSTQFEAFDSHA